MEWWIEMWKIHGPPMSETKYPRQYSNVLERCAAQFCMYIDQPKSMFHIWGNPVHVEHEFTTFYISIIHHFTVSSSSTDETSPCITPLKVGVLFRGPSCRGTRTSKLLHWYSSACLTEGNLMVAMAAHMLFSTNTPPKLNMEPENDGFQKESPFPGTSFQVPC